MSDTPRTDALLDRFDRPVCAFALRDLARQLERENGELRRDKERLDWLLTRDPPCEVILDYAFDAAWDTKIILDSRAALDKAMKEQPCHLT